MAMLFIVAQTRIANARSGDMVTTITSWTDTSNGLCIDEQKKAGFQIGLSGKQWLSLRRVLDATDQCQTAL